MGGLVFKKVNSHWAFRPSKSKFYDVARICFPVDLISHAALCCDLMLIQFL